MEVSTGFASPTSISAAGDGTGRLFITEQPGKIRVNSNGVTLATAFLDISDRVIVHYEQGLLGLVFPPNFAQKQYFYVNYTRKPDGATVISRFFVSAETGLAEPSSEQILLTIPQPDPRHNGGQLAFGPDGFLYIGMGDGGFSGTTAQNPTNLLGKMLRVDVESNTNGGYIIPNDNPFISNPLYRPEIWATGLRNPWRFSFDRLSGDLFIGDVGSVHWDEINFQPSTSKGGENYGWNYLEGLRVLVNPVPEQIRTQSIAPVFTTRSQNVEALIGGYVCRAQVSSRLNGIYFWGTFASSASPFSSVKGLARDGTNWINCDFLEAKPYHTSTFGQDEAGRVYVADYYAGNLLRIEDSGKARAPWFNPTNGVIFDNIVTLHSLNPGARIRYTTNGTSPGPTDATAGPGDGITIQTGTTIKARAERDDLLPSDITSSLFTVKVRTPIFDPATAAITNPTTLRVSCDTAHATIYYTLDGTEPGTNSILYTGPLTLTSYTYVRAVATRPGFSDSAVVSVPYTLIKVATPILHPASGSVTNATPMTITCATPGATIRYTTGAGTFTTNSPVYTQPFLIDGNTWVNAQAFHPAYAPSDGISRYYNFVDQERTIVSTFAGGAQSGLKDGLRKEALFSTPQGLCFDQEGALYVADGGNHAVRKILPNGHVVTVAGTGIRGFKDGPASTAQFSSPCSVVLDSMGNIFVADRGNWKIRKIDTNSVVVTVAGTTEFAESSGPALTSGTGPLWQMAIDPNDDIYFGVDARVRKFSTDQYLSTLPQAFNGGYLVGVDVTADGTVYCSSGFNGDMTIKTISPSGQVERYAGIATAFSDGPRLSSAWLYPRDLYVTSDQNVYVSDGSRIRLISPDGWVSSLAGGDLAGFADGSGQSARFDSPQGLCVDARGNVYVADQVNNRIRKISFDLDGDTIPDNEEGAGTPFSQAVDDRFADSDSDGHSNASEYWTGTDPDQADSVLRVAITSTTSNAAVVSWQSAPNRRYGLLQSQDLTNWASLSNTIVGDGAIKRLTNQITTPPSQRFFRLSVE